MRDLRSLLDARHLQNLRNAYEPLQMQAANVAGVGQAYPPLTNWNQAVAATFYGQGNPLAPANRERCLIMLLAYTGPAVSLALHIYAGLMEGLSVEETCHIMGLVGCYGGLPKCVGGLLVLERLLPVLGRLADETAPAAGRVLEAIVREFS